MLGTPHARGVAALPAPSRLNHRQRPPQLEYLGRLQGSVRGDTVRIESRQRAADMKQLQLAVDGNCDPAPRLLRTWHTHPYRLDLQNRAIKERSPR
jgi:hypothetical protein